MTRRQFVALASGFLILAAGFLVRPRVAEAAFTVTLAETSNDATGDPSYVFNLPAGVAAGDLLVGCVTADANWTTATWPSPWAQLFYDDQTSYSATCAYLFASGGETTVTITRTGGTADQAVSQFYRIQGAHASTAPAISASALGGSAAPDALVATATWASGETNLFITFAMLNGTATVTTYPTNGYGNPSYKAEDIGSCGIASARKVVTADSDDAGAFALSATQNWHARTIVIRPAAVAAGSAKGGMMMRGVGP